MHLSDVTSGKITVFKMFIEVLQYLFAYNMANMYTLSKRQMLLNFDKKTSKMQPQSRCNIVISQTYVILNS